MARSGRLGPEGRESLVGHELRLLLLSLLPSPQSQVSRRDLGFPLTKPDYHRGVISPEGISSLGRRTGCFTAKAMTEAYCTCSSLLRLSENFYLVSHQYSSLPLPSAQEENRMRTSL